MKDIRRQRESDHPLKAPMRIVYKIDAEPSACSLSYYGVANTFSHPTSCEIWLIACSPSNTQMRELCSMLETG